eukprot:COSAG01_NODE_52_length_31456_cov_125.226648_26_plen_314_part_00
MGTTIFIIGNQLAKKYAFFTIKYLGAIYLGFFSIFVSVITCSWLLFFFDLPSYFLCATPIFFSVFLSFLAFYLGRSSARPRFIKLADTGKKCRIVHLSDLHFNGLKSFVFTEKLVSDINAQKPDLILFTGDLIDVGLEHIIHHAHALKKLECKYKFAVSGNHDFYANYDVFLKFLYLADFECIDNSNQVLDFKNKFIINLLGLPDNVGFSTKVQDFIKAKIASFNNQDVFHILLRHKPIFFRESVDLGVNLQLSGHTHHGQLPPFQLLVPLYFKYAFGLYAYQNSYLYTSPGTSTWGPPMRLFSRSEFTVIDI